MNDDARSKLRNMGGIMASSPELMQAAQGFQVGGPVAPQPPMVGRAPLPPRPAPGPMSLNRAIGSPTRPMSPPSVGLPPAAMRELTGDARDRALAGTAPSFGSGTFLSDVPPMPLEEDIGVDDLLDRPTPTAPTPRTPSRPSVERQNELRARRGLPPLSIEQEGEFAKSEREAPLPQDVSRVEEINRKLAEIESRKIDGMAASSQDAADEERLQSEKRQLGKRAGETIAAEDTAMAQSLVPKKLDQSVIDKAVELARKDPNIPTGEDTPPPDGDGDQTTPPPDGDGDGDGDQTPPPKETKRDLRSRYNEKVELFKEIYGTDDRDEAQDRAMSLATIGLAIAAGQSPNALTNIAQGALAGLQGMGAQREADRERERGIRTLALETAIGQQEAETEAAAEAAQADIEQANKLELEEFKAQLEKVYGGAGGSRDARNIIDFTQNSYNEAFKAASAQTAPDFDPETETPHQYALRQARAAAQGMGRMFPGYGGGGAPAAPTQATQEAPETPTVTSQAEYDALPSGAQFMQNGQLRRKP